MIEDYEKNAWSMAHGAQIAIICTFLQILILNNIFKKYNLNIQQEQLHAPCSMPNN
jgi:hypothetical protein